MIRLNTNDQGSLAVFVLAPEDRHRAKLDCPTHISITVDEDHFRGSSVEAFTSRWVLIASMLTGISCDDLFVEGVEVRKLVECEWVPRPVPEGTQFVGVNPFLQRAFALHASGSALDDTLDDLLRMEGATPIQVLQAVMAAYGIPLVEAKGRMEMRCALLKESRSG